MKKQFKKALTLLLTLAIMLSTVLVAVPASAATFDGNTDFMSGNYGMFIHYLASKYVDAEVNTEEFSTQWNAAVNSFDVAAFANQARDLGVSWVTLTLTQADSYYPMPMPELNAFMDNGVDYGTERDLVEDLYAALDSYGIKLMLYWVPGAPDGNEVVAEKLGATERYVDEKGNEGGYLLNDTTVNNMATIMSAVSKRYGDKVTGWWIDGCYTTSANFTESYAKIEAAALRAGNADALIAFNNGTSDGDCRYSVESYTAGETCHVWKTDTIFDYSATSRWSDKGYQKHFLTFLGGDPEGGLTDKGWGYPGALYNTEELVDHVVNNMLMPGAAVTLDVAVASTGAIDTEQANQISAIKKALNIAKVGSDFDMPINFENGASPYTFADHIKNNALIGFSTIGGGQIDVVSGDKALNGEYSLRVVPHNATDIADSSTATRTDILLGSDWKEDIKIPGNPNFSKTDFTNVTGIMLRMKIEGDTTSELYHNFYVKVSQSGVGYTFLGRGAVVYDASGNKLDMATSAGNGVKLPEGFDGFIFLPFETARGNDATFAGSGVYQNYKDTPEMLADFSKPYTAALVLYDAGWGGSKVYIDDIQYYSGTTAADHWAEMKELGYTIVQGAEQPSAYDFPITFDDGKVPFGGVELAGYIYKLVTTETENEDGSVTTTTTRERTGYLPGGIFKYSNVTTQPKEVISGNASMKIKFSEKILKNNVADTETEIARANTAFFAVNGNSLLSNDKIIETASIGENVYIKLKVSVSNDGMNHGIWVLIQKDGVKYSLGNGILAYNADGTKNTSVTAASTYVSLPSGFNGTLYFPVYELRKVDAGYVNPLTWSSADYPFKNDESGYPSLDDGFNMAVAFRTAGSTESIDNATYIIDDIDVVTNNYALDWDYEDQINTNIFNTVKAQYKNASGGYSTVNGTVALVNGAAALTGNHSLKFTLPANADYNLLNATTNKVTVEGNPNFTFDDLEKVTGIMMRIKLEEGNGNTAAHEFVLEVSQSGVATHWIGRKAKLYDINGNVVTQPNTWRAMSLPAGFDGFIFIPFNGAFCSSTSHYYDSAAVTDPSSEFVDYSKEFGLYMYFLDGNTDGMSYTLDDVTYYSGSSDDAAWNAMRTLGYQVLHADQPTSYDIPLDFEGLENPFISSKSWYSYNGGYPTVNTSNALVGSDKAISGAVSGAVTFKTDATYEAGGKFIRAETNFATFKGNAALDKETLGKASSTYAYLTMKVKFPSGEGKYQFYLNLKQDGLAGTTTFKATFGYTEDGSRVNFETADLYCYIPAGFEGTLYFPISRALYWDGANGRGTYATKADLMVDLTKDFQMQLYTYGTQWKNSEVLIDDIGYKFNVLGDVTEDGLFNVNDVIAIRRHILGKKLVSANVGDFNADGLIDIRDLIRVKNMLAE